MRAILALVLSLAASVSHAEETWLCKAWSTGDGSIVGAPFVMTGTPKRYTWVNIFSGKQLIAPKVAIDWVADGLGYGVYVGGGDTHMYQYAYYLAREERKLTMQWSIYNIRYNETTCRLQN